MFRRTSTLLYALGGLSIGLLFPIVATLVEMAAQNLPVGIASATSLQRTNQLLWIIDTAPLVLGLLAAIAGNRQDTLMQLNAALNAREVEMKTAQATIEKLIHERTAELENATRHISRRAAQLATITELSESIAELHDLNEILPAASELISEGFGFYHVGIFLLDRDGEYAILQAANSEGGKRMKRRNHSIQMGTGEVGY
jgi:hypothetical protein